MRGHPCYRVLLTVNTVICPFSPLHFALCALVRQFVPPTAPRMSHRGADLRP